MDGIFQNGLLSGLLAGKSDRLWPFLMGFIRGDPRDIAPGRQRGEYDTEIFSNVERASNSASATLSPMARLMALSQMTTADRYEITA